MTKKQINDINIPEEEINRIRSEKEKVLALSEIKYHAKSIINLADKLKSIDPSYSDSSIREIVKFLLTRHASSETFDDVYNYIENVQESFFEKLVDGLKDEE